MTKTYTPGPEADAIVEQQLATGNYGSADEVVRAGLRLLAESEANEAGLEELRKLIDEGDADIAAGRIHRYANADELRARPELNTAVGCYQAQPLHHTGQHRDSLVPGQALTADIIARGEADSGEDAEHHSSSET